VLSIAMTRVLLTYSNASERKLAARRASRLSARGVDVDLATATAAAQLPAAAYDRVLEASSCEPVPPGETGHEGRVYIASAGFDHVPSAPAFSAERPPAKRSDVLTALVVGAIAAIGLTTLSLPVFYPIGVGLLVALAMFAVLTELHAPPPLVQTPSGSTPLARCG
jgi:hypothetical protein